MTIEADLHAHTLASSHAFSTMQEMVEKARSLGYHALAITDHGIGMPDAPHDWYFGSILHLPSVIDDDMLLLKGVEANAIDINGNLDMPDELLAKLDWVICSMHQYCVEPQEPDVVTDMWLAIAKNPYVDMIGHAETDKFFCDYDKVTKAFAANNKVVEMNASSRLTRPGNEGNLRKLAIACKENGAKISVNSDAHSVYLMDCLSPVLAMLEEINFPEELIVNTCIKKLLDELVLHKRKIVTKLHGTAFAEKHLQG